MARATGDRPPGRRQLALSCSECGSRNYKTTKPRREGVAPLELKKFCKHCNRHTKHIEST